MASKDPTKTSYEDEIRSSMIEEEKKANMDAPIGTRKIIGTIPYVKRKDGWHPDRRSGAESAMDAINKILKEGEEKKKKKRDQKKK